MATATSRAKFKPIKAREKYHACISYHKTDENTVQKHIVKQLKNLDFKIKEVSCESLIFSESLKESDAWVEVLTDKYKACKCRVSYYNTFTDTRQETKTKELQKLIQIPPQDGDSQIPPQDGDRQGILLCVHSDYSADVDAFSGLESNWLEDLQLAIVTRFHAFLSYHESNETFAKKIMEWLTEKGYLVTHKRKFLSANDAKKKAVEEKMSDKIIILFSDSYMKNRGDLDLVKPVFKDRGNAGCIPVMIEMSEATIQYLHYQPRVIMLSDKSGGMETEKWNKGMEKIQKGIDNPDGLPSDCETVRKDGPPGILHYQSIKSVFHSVGKIKVGFDTNDMYGTGFCVGRTKKKLYVFTAYHVIEKKIDHMIYTLLKGCGKDQAKEQNLLENIGFSDEEAEYFNGEKIGYWQTKAGELKLGALLDRRQKVNGDPENKKEVVKMWETVSIDFLSEKRGQETETFHFEMDIPFMSQEHDVILLMLKASTDSNFPEPLQLDFHGIDNSWHLVGCKANQDISNAAIATWCPVFDEHSFEDSKYWWLRRKSDQGQLKKINQQFSDLDGYKGLTPFKCTELFERGYSGSPCWCVNSKGILVQGVYLGCLPDASFAKQKEEPKYLAFSHRPEIALSMKKILEILQNSNLYDLIRDLRSQNQ